MRVSQRDRKEDGRSRPKIKECPSLKLQGKRRKSIVNLPHSKMHEATFGCSIKYLCGTENVEIQHFKGIFNFCLNISSYVKIYFSEPSVYKRKKEKHILQIIQVILSVVF